MKNVLKPLAKGVLILLGLTVAGLVTDAAINQVILRTYFAYSSINNFQ